MTEYFKDYYWKKGIPIGISRRDFSYNEEKLYKVVTDPYRKRISIEFYVFGKWHSVIYDSILLDFRKLNPMDQIAWNKEFIYENIEESECLIKDQNDRIVWKEKYLFKQSRCIQCNIYSPQNIPLCVQYMYYKEFGHQNNGIELLDMNNHLVMYKIYEVDEETKLFSNIIKEDWEIDHSAKLRPSF